MTKYKFKSRRQIVRLVKQLRQRGKCIVFTNGCFDILHAGHVYYLEQSRKMGDCLVVGLNSDRSVRCLKGQARPINKVTDRARVLASLECVDYVVVFNGLTPLSLIRLIKPNVLVKGADWRASDIVGAEEVVSWGGEVRRVQLLKGKSTSGLVGRLTRTTGRKKRRPSQTYAGSWKK